MALTINTNIASLNAQRNLNLTQGRLNTAMQRLTSGMRINSAKDDAAGLAISTRFTTQINGLGQARRNASDGISLAQTSESALAEVTRNLQRIRELALQSVNGSNSDSDRKALNDEVVERLAEITRVATQTNFNGMKVLDGSGQRFSFQVGANVGEVIHVGLGQGVRADQLGQVARGTVDLSSVFSATAYKASQAVATDWTAANANTLGTKTYDGFDVDWSTYKGATVDDAKAFLAGELGGGYKVAVNGTSLDVSRAAGGGQLVLAKGDLSLSAVGADAFDIAGTFHSVQALADAVNAHSRTGITAFVGNDGKLNVASQKDVTVAGTRATGLGFQAAYAVDNATTLAEGSVLTRDAANELVSRVDAALESVSGTSSLLGAIQNRFESTISNVDSIAQNLTESRSAIADSDFGQETGNKSMAMILQQSGIAMLAQANASKQAILKLLE